MFNLYFSYKFIKNFYILINNILNAFLDKKIYIITLILFKIKKLFIINYYF